jgi:hypothetical protein
MPRRVTANPPAIDVDLVACPIHRWCAATACCYIRERHAAHDAANAADVTPEENTSPPNRSARITFEDQFLLDLYLI